MVPGAGIEPARLAAGDFESPASTNFTTRAVCSEAADYGIGDCANCLLHIAWLALAYSAPKQLNTLTRFQEPISVRLPGCKRQGRRVHSAVRPSPVQPVLGVIQWGTRTV